MALEEGLGEGLGAFQLRGGAARAEAAQAARREQVGDARDQRAFRPDDRQRDALALREVRELLELLRTDGYVAHLRLARRAGIAGRDEHLGDARRLRAFPGQRMLAAAAADNEYLDARCLPCAQ